MCGAFPTGSLLATYMGGYITGGLSPLPAYPTYGGLSLLAPYWLHIWGASFWLHIPHVGGFPYWLPTGCIYGGLHNWGAFLTACISHMWGAFPTGSLLAAYMGGYITGGLSPLPAHPTCWGLSLLAPYWLHIWGATYMGGFIDGMPLCWSANRKSHLLEMFTMESI